MILLLLALTLLMVVLPYISWRKSVIEAMRRQHPRTRRLCKVLYRGKDGVCYIAGHPKLHGRTPLLSTATRQIGDDALC